MLLVAAISLAIAFRGQLRAGTIAARSVGNRSDDCTRPQPGYALRMGKARVTATVGQDALKKAERHAKRGPAMSVSGRVRTPMGEKARRDLAALLLEMTAENGPATANEEAWARAVLEP